MYQLNDTTMARLKLEKAIYNHSKENEVLTEVLNATELYGDKVYNKRFATFVNQKLIKKFGSEMYERYGRDDEEVGNAYCYLKTEELIKKHIYFCFVYDGVELQRDYDSNKTELRKHRQFEQLYNTDTLEELKQSITNRIKYNASLITKLKDNKKRIATLANQYNKLVSKINVHNDKITYAISDELKIK